MVKDLYVEQTPTPPADLEVGDVYWFSSYDWTFLLSDVTTATYEAEDPASDVIVVGTMFYVQSITGEVWACRPERDDIHRVLPTSELWVVTNPTTDRDYEFGPAPLNRCKQYKREKGRGLDLTVQRYNSVEVTS